MGRLSDNDEKGKIIWIEEENIRTLRNQWKWKEERQVMMERKMVRK